jgi:RNA polymerase sigma factor (sigma-70 family)
MIVHASLGVDETVESNRGLVRLIVRSLIRSGYLQHWQFDEAMQEGTIGLWSAVRNGFPGTGKGINYAYTAIRRQITMKFGRERMQAKVLMTRVQTRMKATGIGDPTRRNDASAELFDERLDQLRVAIGKLEPEIAELICTRFGIQGYRPAMVKELSTRMKISMHEVREKERLGLEQLREILASVE